MHIGKNKNHPQFKYPEMIIMIIMNALHTYIKSSSMPHILPFPKKAGGGIMLYMLVNFLNLINLVYNIFRIPSYISITILSYLSHRFQLFVLINNAVNILC